jgi:8-oxo-dGTP diphosphatase
VFTIGAFAIIFDDQDQVLLCHRRDMDLWNLPGGGVESGELPTDAVLREVREETGLEVVIERLVGVYGKPAKDDLVFAFSCRVVGGELSETDESDACGYFPFEAIPPNTPPKHVERVQDALDHGQPVFRVQTAPSARDILNRLQSTTDPLR